MKKRYTVSLAALLLAAMLAGCSGPASSGGSSGDASGNATVRFMWWGGETRHKATVEAMDLYMEDHPEVKVEYEYGGWEGYFDKLLTQLAGNNAPDIVQMSYTNVGEYVVRDQLEPLNAYIDSGALSVDKLNRELLDVYNIDGNYYAVPAGVNVQLLFYNRDAFAEYGVAEPETGMTMDEMYAAAIELTEKARAAGEENFWGMAPYGGAFDVDFQRVLIDNGGQLWSDDLKTAAFNSEAGFAALAFLKRPLEEGFAPPPEVTSSNPEGVTDFSAGRVGMEINNATSAAGYFSTADFEIGMALAPFGNNHKVTWYQASQVYVITKQSGYPEEAARIIDYLVNDQKAAEILGFERGIPANAEILSAAGEGKEEYEQEELALVNSAADYTGDGVPMPFPAGYLEIHTEYGRLLEAYQYGEMSAGEMLESLAGFADKTIAKFE